jgi:uncharacterized protein YndB with AHSA1/START domain
MDAWMMPTNEIEAKAGGRFFMGFSQGPDAGFRGVISQFKENELVEYDFDNGEVMRFEITDTDGGTKLVFTHVIVEQVLKDMAPPDGKDEPWQPGLMAGWHKMLDTLAGWLDGDASVTAKAALELSLALQEGNYPPDMQELMERYTAKVLT